MLLGMMRNEKTYRIFPKWAGPQGRERVMFSFNWTSRWYIDFYFDHLEYWRENVILSTMWNMQSRACWTIYCSLDCRDKKCEKENRVTGSAYVRNEHAQIHGIRSRLSTLYQHPITSVENWINISRWTNLVCPTQKYIEAGGVEIIAILNMTNMETHCSLVADLVCDNRIMKRR